MDFSAVLSDSVTYAREAFIGKWLRWAIFIIFALPASLIQFVINPKTILTETGGINWSAIPWIQIAILCLAGLLLSFFLTGYIVRIYRGVKPAPDFTEWMTLFVDGIKLDIVWFIWLLPVIVITILAAALFAVTIFSGQAGGHNVFLLLLVPILLLVGLVLIIIVVLFGILGVIRFARTNSILEGISFSQILKQIRTIGWANYIISLIIFAVAVVIYCIIVMVIALIPYIGWVIVLVVNPFYMIFMARYFTLVYEQGEQHQVPPAPVE